MSDQSLRAALEQKLATTDGWTVSNEFLLGLLAAHPAEPAQVVSDEAASSHGPAVRAIASEFMARYKGTPDPDEFALNAAQAGLLAALPLLGPRPLLDREAALQAIVAASEPEGSDNIMGREYVENYADVFADAVLKLARPMPTRDQVEAAVRKTIFAYFGTYERPVELITDDVTALLNGAES